MFRVKFSQVLRRSLVSSSKSLGESRHFSTNLKSNRESPQLDFSVHQALGSSHFSKLEGISHIVPASLQTNIHYLEYPKVGCSNPSVKLFDISKGEKTLITIHGSYQTAYTFDDLINSMDELSPLQPLRVISVDLPGHGDSSWYVDGNYSVQALRDDVARLIDNLGIQDYYLLGNGLGSLVALDIASSNRFACNLMGVIPIEVPSSPRKLRVHDSLRYNASFSSFDKFVDFCMGLNPKTTEKSMRKRLEMAIREDPLSGKWSWKRDPRFNFDTDFFQGELELLVSKVNGLANRTKVMVVRGEHSEVSSQRSTEKLLKNVNDSVDREERKATAITLPGGHVLHGDAPNLLAKNILKFMDLL